MSIEYSNYLIIIDALKSKFNKQKIINIRKRRILL